MTAPASTRYRRRRVRGSRGWSRAEQYVVGLADVGAEASRPTVSIAARGPGASPRRDRDNPMQLESTILDAATRAAVAPGFFRVGRNLVVRVGPEATIRCPLRAARSAELVMSVGARDD